MTTTQSVRLRAVEPSDIEMMMKAENDADSWRDSDIYAPYSRVMLEKYVSNYSANPFDEGQLRLIAEDEQTGDVVGIADFFDISLRHARCFVGIYILPEHRAKGFGTTTLTAMIEYAERYLMMHTIAAHVIKENEQAMRLFEKCGFLAYGLLPHWHHSAGRFHDLHLLVRQSPFFSHHRRDPSQGR